MGTPRALSPGPLCSPGPPSRGRLMVITIQTSLKTPRKEKSFGREFFFFFLITYLKGFLNQASGFTEVGISAVTGPFRWRPLASLVMSDNISSLKKKIL